ncbi:MAG: hypothetical protein LPJ86_01560 [Caulobacteraceae bacterium]|nr:hypothetical protein [Caulobacteraceae bacterium]
MPKRFNNPMLAQWVNEGLNRVLGGDAQVQGLNGASGFAIDMFGEPVQGLRPGYGRGGMPPPAQVGGALGTMVNNFRGLRHVGPAMEDQITETDPEREKTGHGPDKYFHCKANCEAARLGPYGEAAGWVLSDVLKEGFDGAVDPLGRRIARDEDRHKYFGVDPKDRAANAQGRAIGRSGGQCQEGCKALAGRGAEVPPRYR